MAITIRFTEVHDFSNGDHVVLSAEYDTFSYQVEVGNEGHYNELLDDINGPRYEYVTFGGEPPCKDWRFPLTTDDLREIICEEDAEDGDVCEVLIYVADGYAEAPYTRADMERDIPSAYERNR